MEPVAAGNEEVREAWDGPLFDRFHRYRDLVAYGLGGHGEEALALAPAPSGARVLDLGCGFGETTMRLAEMVGPEGSVLGVDISDQFLELARRETEAAGVANASYLCADVQTVAFEGRFDYAFSRMGLMFFANPVAALRNIAAALVPGATLCAVVWRRKLDNGWLHRAEQVVEEYLDHPEESDEPTCGPGPFSMADADTVTEQLRLAGFEAVTLRRCDRPIKIGDDLDHAVEFAMALGPAGEVLREWGDRVDEIRPKIAADLRVALAEFVTGDGVVAPASTWIITARAPAGADQ